MEYRDMGFKSLLALVLDLNTSAQVLDAIARQTLPTKWWDFHIMKKLVCHPLCSQDTLDYVARNCHHKELLDVIGARPNLGAETAEWLVRRGDGNFEPLVYQWAKLSEETRQWLESPDRGPNTREIAEMLRTGKPRREPPGTALW